MAKPEYYIVISHLKQEHGFVYAKESKNINPKNNKPYNISEKVSIPGQYRPKDKPAVTFITAKEYNELIKPQHGGAESPFKHLIRVTDKGGTNGILVKPVEDFTEMPEEFQKKFDLARFTKLRQAKLKADKKILEEVPG
jgi:hypothetical protein